MRIYDMPMTPYHLYNTQARPANAVAPAVAPGDAPSTANTGLPPAAPIDPFGAHASVSISDEARALYEASVAALQAECAACANRSYVDRSTDGAVSFQMPTRISPNVAPALVAAHEAEHLSNDRARAEQEGRTVVAQSMRLFTSICPDCGRIFVSGGEARTVTALDQPPAMQQNNPVADLFEQHFAADYTD